MFVGNTTHGLVMLCADGWFVECNEAKVSQARGVAKFGGYCISDALTTYDSNGCLIDRYNDGPVPPNCQ